MLGRLFYKGLPPDPVDPAALPPGARYRAVRGKARWRGPAYRLAGPWQRDLLAITGELATLARLNAPLTHGLEAFAHEQRRQLRQVPGRVRGVLAVLAGALLGSVLASIGPRSGRGDELLYFVPAIILSVVLVVITWRRLPRARVLFGGLLVASVSGLAFGPLFRLPLSILVIFLVAPLVTHALVVLLAARQVARREAVLLVMRDRLAAGMGVSEAMASLPRVFPAPYVRLVQAGEEAGCLAERLTGLQDETVVRIMARRSVTPTLLYLGMNVLLQVSLISYISVKVMPVFREIHEEFGSSISPIAAGIMQAVDFAGARMVWLSQWPVWPAALLVLAAASFAGIRVARFLARQVLPALPGLRAPMARRALVPVAQVLSLLLRAGVPLTDALAQVARIPAAPRHRHALERVQARVLNGEDFAAACTAEHRTLPGSFGALAALGDSAGRLPETLDQAAELYRRQADTRFQIALNLALPAGIGLLGVLVFAIQYGVYHTLWSLSDALINSM
jgi:type II secretory pathway component PulF